MPFIDTREVDRLSLVCNLLAYPHEFCMKESNHRLLHEFTSGVAGAYRLVEVLQTAQSLLRAHLPLTGVESAWREHRETVRRINIKTIASDLSIQRTAVQHLHESLNLQILEGSFVIQPQTQNGSLSTEALQLAANCIWLSDLLALIVLRIAVIDQTNPDKLILRPTSEEAARHLRRLWFGIALEEASLHAASFAVERLAIAASQPKYRRDLKEARINALCIFPQHWRLPPNNGPLGKILFSHLEPLLAILIHSIVSKQNPARLAPFGITDAKQKGIEDIFTEILSMQAALPAVDRLFDVVDGRLKLGTRSLGPGAIAIAEHLAKISLGKDWHGNETSSSQKAYVIERIGRNPQVEVLDFELRQHDTEANVALDVDFFVRDKGKNQLYGIQLKHLETDFRGGVLQWAHRFRKRDGGLGNLVRQLESLQDIARNDAIARKKLMDNGVLPEECDRIVPVGLHNLGAIDFWEVQNGVLLYDIHTFANVLEGREAVVQGFQDGTFFTGKIEPQRIDRPSIHEPDRVIDAYLSDPKFKHLSLFDFSKNIKRSITLDGVHIVAEGLGV